MDFQHMQKLARLVYLPKKMLNDYIPQRNHCLEGSQKKRPVHRLPGNIKIDHLTPWNFLRRPDSIKNNWTYTKLEGNIEYEII